jgi:20S proteasome subunit alpha 4
VRPFGISTLLAGFDVEGTPRLYKTDPSGNYTEWKVSKFNKNKASTCGKNSKTVKEFLEKHYDEETKDDQSTIKLAIKSLMEVVESGSNNIEVVIMEKKGMKNLQEDEVEKFVKEIEIEKKESEEKKKLKEL